MKKYVIILLVLVIGVANVMGQSKKDLQIDMDELRIAIDSFKNEYNSLATLHDSTLEELAAHQTMYNVIKDKVLEYDYNPAEFGSILDSLISGRDATVNSMMEGSQALSDTISMMSESIESLKTEIETQKEEIEGLKAEVEELSKPPATMTDEQFEALKKIKELLDSGILTQEEFESRKTLYLKK